MRPATPVLIALLLGLFSAQEASAQRAVAERWRERVARFERENRALSPHTRNVVLFGSSSMEGWRYGDRERLLPAGPRFLNRGISGDGIGIGRHGLLNRLEASVYDCRPSHVFILNGRNSIGRDGGGVEATAATYRQVVEAIQSRCPDAVVCVVTCAPVNLGYRGMAPHVVALNQRLRTMAAELGCPVIDLHARLVGPDGLLPRARTGDGLHFDDEGYRILGQEIARVLRAHPYPRAAGEGAPAAAPEPQPAAEPDREETPPAAEEAPPPAERTHVVQRGEVLSRIARRYGTSVRALCRLNGIRDPNRLRVGQVLRLPAQEGVVDRLRGLE